MRGGEVDCSRVRTAPPGFEPGYSGSAETKPFALPALSNTATRYSVADVMRSEVKMNLDSKPVAVAHAGVVNEGFQ